MKRLTTAAICIAGIVATTAFAQQAGQPGSQSQTPGIQPSSRDATTYSATGREEKQCRASKVIGAQVKSQSGDELGRIEDIVFNPQSGRVELAVINHENKLVPIPIRLLKSSATGTTATTPGATEQMTFTAQIDKDKLQNAPTISDRTRWSELQQGTFSQRVYSHYGVTIEGVGAPGLGTDRERGTSRDRDSQTPGTTPRSPTSPN